MDITQEPFEGAGAAPVSTPGFVLAVAADNVRETGLVSEAGPGDGSVLATPRACYPIVVKWPGEWFGPVPITRASRGVAVLSVKVSNASPSRSAS